jgi:hypothetical protein
MQPTAHASRRASAAAAAEASQIRPINAKRLGKRPIRPAPHAPHAREAREAAATLAANGGVHDPPASSRPTPGADLPDFDSATEPAEGLPSRASKRPAVPPPPLERDTGGNLSLLQGHAGVDADELCGSQEHALSKYLKLHPVLSLESTSYQTLQLVANLVGKTSIPTRELEIVPKTHDDEYLRRKLPRLNLPHVGAGVPGGRAFLRISFLPLARSCTGPPT